MATVPDPDITTLLAEIYSRLQQLDEAMASVPKNVQQLVSDMSQLKDEVTVMRAVVTDHSYELKAYGERLRDLEMGY